MTIEPTTLAIIGGALAQIGGLVGSSIGMGITTSAGAATLAEDPKQFRNVLILASLPMTQTFYALIVLILIITMVVPKLAAMPDAGSSGLTVLGIGLICAFAEGVSAAYQGIACASSISMLPKTGGRILGSGLILGVYTELMGVLGMVFTILALTMLGLF
jgi:V/A-type H+-transporting ATPase subunit K